MNIKRILIMTFIFLIVLVSPIVGDLTTSIDSPMTWKNAYRFTGGGDDLFLDWCIEMEDLVDATAGTATASKAVVLDASGEIDTLTIGTSGLKILESAGDTFTSSFAGGDQAGDLTYTLPTAYPGSSGYRISCTTSGVMTWAADSDSGTFTGGAITGDITMDDTKTIRSHGTATDYAAIVAYDTGVGYINVLKWTDAATPEVLLGHADASFQLASTGMDVSTAGAVTGVTDLTASGTVDAGTVTTEILTTTGVTTLGNNTAALSIASTGIDISTAGAITNVTNLTLTGDVVMATTKGVKSSTVTAHTVGVYGYDVGADYVAALLITNSATPATVLGNTSGTTAISSSDWTISAAGNAAGLGTITSDGLITGSGGLTLSGTTSINDSATTSTTSVGGGTTTGTVTIGGTGTQALNIGNGAGVKTVALGSNNTSSTTTILGGSNGVKINVGSYDDPIYINTGVNTGAVHIGGTGVQTIAIGDDGTGAKTITIGDGASTGSTVIKAGTGNLNLSAVDDVTLNGGSAGSIIGIGQNTEGNVIRIGQDDTTADTITIGSAKDTAALAGISVTVGSTGSTSATVIQSGSGEIKINESVNQPVSIATGTSTGTVEIGNGDTAQTVTIANGAGAKTVALGSTNSTSTTTISSGSGGLAVDGPVAINTSKATNTTSISAGTTTGTITIGGTGTQAINIGNAAGVKTVALGSINSTSGTVISSGTGDLDIIATAKLDIDVGTTYDMLAAGAFSFDGSNAASNVSLATDDADDDFTVSVTGATDSSLILKGEGTGTDAVKIHTTNANGDVDIDSADNMTVDTVGDLTGTVGGEYILGVTGGIVIDSAEEAADAIGITASGTAGGITFNAGTAGITFSDDELTDIGDIHVDTIYNEGDTDITYSVKTITVTLDMNSVDTDNSDFQWDNTVANQNQQNKDLGALVPAWCEFTSMLLRCYESVDNSPVLNFEIGTASSGSEIAVDADYDTLHALYATAAGDTPEIAVTAAARNIWIGATPDANWDTFEEGKWVISVTYIDYGAAYTAHSKK